MKKKKKKKVFILIIVAIVLVTFFPYIKAEYLTYRYGKYFQDGYLQTRMIDRIEYFRVLKKNADTAEVLYISKGHASANIVRFKKEKGEWIKTYWATVWSKTGCADDFMWPYYP